MGISQTGLLLRIAPRRRLIKLVETEEASHPPLALSSSMALDAQLRLALTWYFKSRTVQLGLVLLNFIQFLSLVVLTYSVEDIVRSVLSLLAVLISFVFVIDYALSLFLHNYGPLTKSSLLSLASCVPVLLLSDSSYSRWIFIFSAPRLLKIPQVFRVSEYLRFRTDPNLSLFEVGDLQLTLLRLIVEVLCFVLVSAGCVYIVSWTVPDSFSTSANEPLSLWGSIYFVVVSVATVGYGDVTPLSWAGQVVTVAVLLSGLALIPASVVRILDAFWRRPKYLDKVNSRGHLVIVGHVHDDFLAECMEATENDHQKLVFLCPREPASRIENILHLFKHRLVWLVGSGHKLEDLHRSNMQAARAVVVLPEYSAFAHSRRENEDDTLLCAINVLRFVKAHGIAGALPRVFVKLNASARSTNLLRRQGVSVVFRAQELQFALLALAVCIPGSLEMLSQLSQATKQIQVDQLWAGGSALTVKEVGRELLQASNGRVIVFACRGISNSQPQFRLSSILVSTCSHLFVASHNSWTCDDISGLLSRVVAVGLSCQLRRPTVDTGAGFVLQRAADCCTPRMCDESDTADGVVEEKKDVYDELLESEEDNEEDISRIAADHTFSASSIVGPSTRSLNVFAGYAQPLDGVGEAHDGQMQGHLVVLYVVPDVRAWSNPSLIMLPLIVFMRGVRRHAHSRDPVVVVVERTEELMQHVPDVVAEDKDLFANLILVKGNPRHQQHLHEVHVSRARAVCILRMPGHAIISDGDREETALQIDRDVLIVEVRVSLSYPCLALSCLSSPLLTTPSPSGTPAALPWQRFESGAEAALRPHADDAAAKRHVSLLVFFVFLFLLLFRRASSRMLLQRESARGHLC